MAREWEGKASEIAAAASAGNSCRALQLANSLRADVSASKEKLPRRLRPPLLTGVTALADRITCTPPTVAPAKAPIAPTKRPEPPHEHGDHGQRDHHGHGHGGKGPGGGGDR